MATIRSLYYRCCAVITITVSFILSSTSGFSFTTTLPNKYQSSCFVSSIVASHRNTVLVRESSSSDTNMDEIGGSKCMPTDDDDDDDDDDDTLSKCVPVEVEENSKCVPPEDDDDEETLSKCVPPEDDEDEITEKCVPTETTAALVSEMRVGEIKAELKTLGVSFNDCFDRESLAKRLTEARSGSVHAKDGNSKKEETTTTTTIPSASTTTSAEEGPFDRDAVLTELRALRVAELRTELSSRGLRWAGMYEKEELVVALANARETQHGFSRSGALTPGRVGELDGAQLDQELAPGNNDTPLLLDVYATWCGPCTMMAPELEQAAQELGATVRVAKMDSDKYPRWSSTMLKVGGFPTVILFDGQGKEVKRVEGAINKQRLVELAQTPIQ